MFKIPPILSADELLDKAFGKAKRIKERDRKTNIIRLNEDLRKVFYH